jgi:hypothetical protein
MSPLILGHWQQHHEKILQSHLEKMGTVVEFGLSNLKIMSLFRLFVTVRRSLGDESLEESRVPWLVGADKAQHCP